MSTRGILKSFHSATFELLGFEPQCSRAAVSEVERAEVRLGFRLPASVREWYSCDGAIRILETHSNGDSPIPVAELTIRQSMSQRLLPFRIENQGVCIWSIMLDGSDDPPVYVDVDSNGRDWHLQASTFSQYVRACVWDYKMVLSQPALVQAQNAPLSFEAIHELDQALHAGPRTFGWPGSTQYRFAGNDYALLIWSAASQADWFVGGRDEASLESVLRRTWHLDRVGESFYPCGEIGKRVLAKFRDEV
jgi:hypothetical protein